MSKILKTKWYITIPKEKDGRAVQQVLTGWGDFNTKTEAADLMYKLMRKTQNMPAHSRVARGNEILANSDIYIVER